MRGRALTFKPRRGQTTDIASNLVALLHRWKAWLLRAGPGEASQQVDAALTLPVELLLQIFEHVPPADIIRCRAVCSRFKQIIDETSEMQYKIELFVFGCQDNEENTSMKVPERLEALRAHQNLWKTPGNCAWSEYIDLSWTSYTGVMLSYDNLWLQSHLNWSLLSGDTLTTRVQLAKNEVKFASFEEADDGAPIIDSWTLSFPFLFENYVADLSKEELYLVNTSFEHGLQCYRVRTASLTNNSLLSDRMFKSDIKYDDNLLVRSLVLEKSYKGNILACVTIAVPEFARHAREVLRRIDVALLDAESGEVIDTYSTIPSTREPSFKLVNDKLFILHFMEGGKFTTEVYMLTTSALSQRQKIRHVATFEYPTVRRTYVDMVGYLNCYLSHPDSRPCRGRFSRKRPPRSFEHSFDTELLTVSRHFQDLHVLHCIPMSIFSTVEERLKSYDSRSVGAPVIRWEAWGPENTRCFLDMQDDYQPVHFGHQVLLGDLMLLDFNQLAINRDLQPITQHCNRIRNDEPTPTKKAYWSLRKGRLGKSQSHSDEDLQVDDMYAQDSDVRIISFPSVISRGEVFDEDVVTTLPYRKTYLKWDRNRIYPQIFFGGERWAAMSRDGPGAGYNAGESYSVFCRRRAPCL